jgi:hypothetical protein
MTVERQDDADDDGSDDEDDCDDDNKDDDNEKGDDDDEKDDDDDNDDERDDDDDKAKTMPLRTARATKTRRTTRIQTRTPTITGKNKQKDTMRQHTDKWQDKKEKTRMRLRDDNNFEEAMAVANIKYSVWGEIVWRLERTSEG